MVTVTYTANRLTYELQVTGHADYAEHGKDIVCSAVSILLYTAANRLDSVCDRYTQTLEPGKARIWAYGLKAQQVMDTIICGFRLLAEQYPDHVVLIEQ